MLLSDAQIERIEAEALRLLEDVGLLVETEQVADLMVEQGCTPLPSGRLRIPRELVLEVMAVQRERLARGDAFSPGARQLVEPRPEAVISSAFSHGPTRYYDLAQDQIVSATLEIGDEMLRLAAAMPEVAMVQPFWVPVGNPRTQSVERLVRSLLIAPNIAAMDVMDPGEYKYMMEIGTIITGEPKSMQYVLQGQCLTPPLKLCDRAGRGLLEMARLGIPYRSTATMTNIGVTAPVTRWGALLQSVAEMLAGWVAATATDPEVCLIAHPAVVSIDMATGEATMVSPDMAWVNAAFREFFVKRQGGNTGGTGTQYGATTTRPGFQTVCENLYMMYAVAVMEERPVTYQGAGQLSLGGVGCPEQLMIDIEVASAMREINRPTEPMTEDALALDALREVISEDRTFLDHDHTLTHMRGLWRPTLIRWDGCEVGSERAVLERAGEMWRERLSRYEPPGWPDDTLCELERVRLAARRELLGE